MKIKLMTTHDQCIFNVKKLLNQLQNVAKQLEYYIPAYMELCKTS